MPTLSDSPRTRTRALRQATRRHLAQLRAERVHNRFRPAASGAGSVQHSASAPHADHDPHHGGEPLPAVSSPCNEGSHETTLPVSLPPAEDTAPERHGVATVLPEPHEPPDGAPSATGGGDVLFTPRSRSRHETQPDDRPFDSGTVIDEAPGPEAEAAPTVGDGPEMADPPKDEPPAVLPSPPDDHDTDRADHSAASAQGTRQADETGTPTSSSSNADGLSADSDLLRLPGAGPGLVWLLGRCGVESLADLAAADARKLTEQMGLIGELLDIDNWIDFAKAQA